MKTNFIFFSPLFIFVFNVFFAQAQLGFCNGNSGDAIFIEDFGAGTVPVALPPNTTTFLFQSSFPTDGSYLVSNSSSFFGWHTNVDHTGNANGRYLTVNADDAVNGGEFYKTTISGLCENTSYEFSSWLLNLLPPTSNCPDGGIPINVKFQIWDITNTVLLASGDTGNIAGTVQPEWNQYGLVFTTAIGQNEVILKMLNNGIGGCGNDLAIDDIVFKSCGDFIDIANDENETFTAVCEDQGSVSTVISAIPDFNVFNTHFYQWQQSTDGENWTDIIGETTNTYTTPILNSSIFYRVKVAEDPINVSNSLCNVISEVYEVFFVPVPDSPMSNGDLENCANEMQFLSVNVPQDTTVDWYDAPVGGNLLLANSPSFKSPGSGTYYAEARSVFVDCISLTRTAVTSTFHDLPVVSDENLTFCEGTTLFLSAGTNNDSYLWSTGETTQSIAIETPDTYTVTVTNSNSCSVTKTIVVDQIDNPIIDRIISNNENIEVRLLNTGEFEYALNNGLYQDSPIFELIEGGEYTINVRGKNNCPAVNRDFLHFVIPKFFTPNGDNINDQFTPQGLEFFNTVEISVFDRYGKLLVNSSDHSFNWNGTFNGNQLPASDYWYTIKTDTEIFNGHFALIR